MRPDNQRLHVANINVAACDGEGWEEASSISNRILGSMTTREEKDGTHRDPSSSGDRSTPAVRVSKTTTMVSLATPPTWEKGDVTTHLGDSKDRLVRHVWRVSRSFWIEVCVAPNASAGGRFIVIQRRRGRRSASELGVKGKWLAEDWLRVAERG